MPHIPEPILAHVAPFLLVLFRISGLFLFAPILSSTTIPARIRLLLALAMSLVIYPTIPPNQMAPVKLDLFVLGAAVFAETFVGLIVGFIASLPLYAVQLAGLIMGQQTGMSLGGIFNPALESESDAVGQLLMYLAIAAFLALGGLEHMFLALARSFHFVPLGGVSATIAPLELVVGVVSSGFELALRVAAPVLCILMVETVAASVLARTLPQINLMSIGYGVKIILGLVVLAAAIVSIEPAIAQDVAEALGLTRRWIESLGSPASEVP